MRWFITLLSFVVLPCLPERHQRRWPWEPPASLGALAQVSAYANSIVAVVFWGTAFVLYQKTYGDPVSALIYQNGDVSYITWSPIPRWEPNRRCKFLQILQIP